MNLFSKRPCPVCGSSKISKNIISTHKKAENLNFNSLKPYWNGFFKEKIIFSYARCNSCSLIYAPKFFSNNQLAKLYSQMSANMDIVPRNVLQKTQYGYFTYLKKNSPLIGNFMEIGPDIGLFTKFCVTEGNFKKFWLFEPNKAVRKNLIKVVNNNEFHIIDEMTNFKAVPANSIDAVVGIHVIDHLLDPVKILKNLSVKMKSSAKLLIVTHDEQSLLRRIFGWRWPAFCLQHPQIYNRSTVRSLLNASGFNVVGQYKTVNYFKLSFLLKHFFWALGIKIKSIPNFGDFTLGLKLGNIVTIATRAKI
jgi:hypothetical protein